MIGFPFPILEVIICICSRLSWSFLNMGNHNCIQAAPGPCTVAWTLLLPLHSWSQKDTAFFTAHSFFLFLFPVGTLLIPNFLLEVFIHPVTFPAPSLLVFPLCLGHKFLMIMHFWLEEIPRLLHIQVPKLHRLVDFTSWCPKFIKIHPLEFIKTYRTSFGDPSI